MSVYIQINIIEKNIDTCALIDTSSEITIMKSFLSNQWKSNGKLKIIGITCDKQQVNQSLINFKIFLGSKIVRVNHIFQYDRMDCDILLGNDFIQQFQYYQQTTYMITLKTSCNHILRIPREFKPYRVQPTQRGDTFSYEKQHLIQKGQSYNIQLEIIKSQLEQVYRDNPLALWKPDHPRAKIELIENRIIRLKPIMYTEEDREEFKIQTKELLNLKLIRTSNNPHNSPIFMVRKRLKQVRGKTRMVINYKELNKYTKFDGYFLPNKKVLINLVKNKTYYSKFDCKSGFWQIKMEEHNIPYTVFSTPQGHYEWLECLLD